MASSRTEVEGYKILKELLGQDRELGGAFCYITGAMGGGKTAAMLSWMMYTLQSHPDQKIFFSETYDAPLQSFKLGRENISFYVKDGSDVVFRDRNNHLKEVDIGQMYFSDFDDLWRISEYGKINTVFFGDRTVWMEFMAYLRHKGEWTHVFIDEFGEIAPANTAGKLYKRIGQFAIFAKDFRKCQMKVIVNTQSVSDMDWRVRDKFMYRVFLPGAVADKKHSRVVQGAIDNLATSPEYGNEAYIDRMGRFGKIKFTDIFKPNLDYQIEAHVATTDEYISIPLEDDEPRKYDELEEKDKILETGKFLEIDLLED